MKAKYLFLSTGTSTYWSKNHEFRDQLNLKHLNGRRTTTKYEISPIETIIKTINILFEAKKRSVGIKSQKEKEY